MDAGLDPIGDRIARSSLLVLGAFVALTPALVAAFALVRGVLPRTVAPCVVRGAIGGVLAIIPATVPVPVLGTVPTVVIVAVVIPSGIVIVVGAVARVSPAVAATIPVPGSMAPSAVAVPMLIIVPSAPVVPVVLPMAGPCCGRSAHAEAEEGRSDRAECLDGSAPPIVYVLTRHVFTLAASRCPFAVRRFADDVETPSVRCVINLFIERVFISLLYNLIFG